MTGYVYKLIDVESGKPLYVGSTVKELRLRKAGHMTNIKKNKSYLYRYIRENNIAIDIVLIEEIEYYDVHQLRLAENKWISKLKKQGLLNKILANDGVLRFTKNIPLRTTKSIMDTICSEAASKNESVNTIINKILSPWARAKKKKKLLNKPNKR